MWGAWGGTRRRRAQVWGGGGYSVGASVWREMWGTMWGSVSSSKVTGCGWGSVKMFVWPDTTERNNTTHAATNPQAQGHGYTCHGWCGDALRRPEGRYSCNHHHFLPVGLHPPPHTHSLALSLVAGFVAYIKPSMRNVRRNAHRNPTTHTSPSSSRLAQTRVASRRGARTYRQREAVEVPLALPPVPPGKAGELEAARAGEDDEQSVDDRRDPDAVVRHAWELRAVPGSVHGVQAAQ